MGYEVEPISGGKFRKKVVLFVVLNERDRGLGGTGLLRRFVERINLPPAEMTEW